MARPFERSDGKPVAVSLLLADRCNHACQHCYQVHGRQGELSFAEVETLLAELASEGVLFLQLSGGEITLRPDLPAILAVARRHHFALSLVTNAYAVSDELVDAIVETGVASVHVSIYSDVASEHDAVTGVVGSFARTVANIERLRARRVRVALNIPLTSFCSAPRERLEDFAARLGCQATITTSITAREDGTTTTQLAAATAEQLRAHHARSESKPTSREAKLDESPCGVCNSSVTIHADGSVRPCTDIPLVMADVHERGALGKVADGEAYRLLAGIRWRDVHGCRDCDLVSWCSRCHGSALQEKGDLFGPQPEACRVAIARFEAQQGPLRRLPAAADVEHRAQDLGPFVLVEHDGLQPIADRITDADRAMRDRHPWIAESKRSSLVASIRLVRRKPR